MKIAEVERERDPHVCPECGGRFNVAIGCCSDCGYPDVSADDHNGPIVELPRNVVATVPATVSQPQAEPKERELAAVQSTERLRRFDRDTIDRAVDAVEAWTSGDSVVDGALFALVEAGCHAFHAPDSQPQAEPAPEPAVAQACAERVERGPEPYAAPIPWKHVEHADGMGLVDANGTHVVWGGGGIRLSGVIGDFNVIVHRVNNWDALIDDRDQLQQQLDEARAAVEFWVTTHNGSCDVFRALREECDNWKQRAEDVFRALREECDNWKQRAEAAEARLARIDKNMREIFERNKSLEKL